MQLRLTSFLPSPKARENTDLRKTFTRRYHQEFISPGAAGFAAVSAGGVEAGELMKTSNRAKTFLFLVIRGDQVRRSLG